MTAMLQQAISLLPLTRLELQQAVQQELLENPVLEESMEDIKEVADGEMPESPEDLPDTQTDERGEVEIDWENIVQDTAPSSSLPSIASDEDFPSYEQTLSMPETLHEHLEWQLNLTPTDEGMRRVAAEIIGNIDDSGYLQLEPEDLAAREGLPAETGEKALALVQEFDPPGVGARNLRECLSLQLKSLGDPIGKEAKKIQDLAERLIERHIENLHDRHFAKLARKNKVSVDEIIAAVELIRSLNPNPGARFSEERVEIATPDVTIIRRGDDFDVILNDDGLPPLRVSPMFRAMMGNRDGTSSETRKYLEERMRAALWFLKSIEQRRQTIMKVTQSIVKFQKEFLFHGVSHLRPLVLRDVAEDIEMHESTVSRVTTGKYMETPQGVFNFKYFFHSGLESRRGGSTSSVAVKEQIREIVVKENKKKPLTDQEIVNLLKNQDVVIARRTVTKYRKELRLPAASRRRQFH